MKVDFRYEADLSFNRELPNKIQRPEIRFQTSKQTVGLYSHCFQIVNSCWENLRSRKLDSMSLEVFKPRLRAFLKTKQTIVQSDDMADSGVKTTVHLLKIEQNYYN